MYIAHLTIDSNQNVNRPAITEALKPFQTLEYTTGSWWIKSNDPTTTIWERLRPVVGNQNAVCLFSLKPDSLIGGIWPETVRDFLGTSATQAA